MTNKITKITINEKLKLQEQKLQIIEMKCDKILKLIEARNEK